MKFKFLFFPLVAVFCVLFSVLCQAQEQERFIYDARAKKDPFIPLTDEESPTGLRTVFALEAVAIKLPVEISVKGILWSGQEYFAIVNGEVMKKGEKIGEVKVKEIEQDKVILEYKQKEFTIFLKKE